MVYSFIANIMFLGLVVRLRADKKLTHDNDVQDFRDKFVQQLRRISRPDHSTYLPISSIHSEKPSNPVGNLVANAVDGFGKLLRLRNRRGNDASAGSAAAPAPGAKAHGMLPRNSRAPHLNVPPLLELQSEAEWMAKLKELVHEHGLDAVESWRDDQDKHRHHLIHLAVARNFLDVVKMMVSELGFDVNIPRVSDKCTPLHLAIWFQHPDMAALLLSLGADQDLENAYGESCGEKYAEFVRSRERLRDADTIEMLLKNYHKHTNFLDHSNLAPCWSAIGQLAKREAEQYRWLHNNPSSLERLVEHTVRAAMAGEVLGPDLAQVAYGAACSGSRALASALTQAVEEHVSKFSAKGLSITAWAFATAGQFDEALFEALAKATERRAGEVDAQGLANLVWAFARVGNSDKELFTALARAVEEKIDEFNVRTLANTAWAFATAGQYDEKLFSALARAAERRLSEFTVLSLANTAWAFGRAGRQSDEKLFAALVRAAERPAGELHVHELVRYSIEAAHNWRHRH
eukprot:gnl/TRDRNA2_/TRDRNA2_177331_c8_seq4.p1 gnl/TRDRNA2_/TRDRNA2_177331_c8~~gnl/TRDRNA2_/TRDRNA2_177331_c8_seq4.p1  ORF type:complete len:519 (+),score=80.68 gnl/TRDRNA2_/TRDRNA2_177331_c8_seq4:77-1633(+)